MLRMLYTKTNRYGIDQNELNKFLSHIKESVVEIRIAGERYLTDGQSYYNPDQFEDMLNGKLFPFPEHVSLINKVKYRPENIDQLESELIDCLKRPRAGSGIYE